MGMFNRKFTSQILLISVISGMTRSSAVSAVEEEMVSEELVNSEGAEEEETSADEQKGYDTELVAESADNSEIGVSEPDIGAIGNRAFCEKTSKYGLFGG